MPWAGATSIPPSSRNWFLRIWGHQHRNGWLPHGMPFAEGVDAGPDQLHPPQGHQRLGTHGADVLHVRDAAISASSTSRSLLPTTRRRSASLYEHICLGLEWLLQGSNAARAVQDRPGRLERPAEHGRHRGEGRVRLAYGSPGAWRSKTGRRWRRDAVTGLAAPGISGRRPDHGSAINRLAWDGRWYARGFTDAGKPFGVRANREGRIFLNAQSWAIMCGAADARRASSCIQAVERDLMTQSGPMTLAPAYTRMQDDIGKLTQKMPGWNENGSVYCHAATFYAYALFAAREADRGYAALRILLPGGRPNTLDRAGQLPLYIPNFFRGAASGRNAGRSSHAPNTGTASWYYRTAVGMLMGVRAEFEGLRIDPQLPGAWRRARVWRAWRGAEFDIQIHRTSRVRRTEVFLDGDRLPDNLVPVQTGGRHHVEVRLPLA